MITLEGKYTNATIYATTIEEDVYKQVYDIINHPAFEGQTVVLMPDVHVGKSGPCGLVATIGDYVCPEHIGVDIGCSVSAMILDKKIPVEKYADFEHKVKTKVPFGFEIHKYSVNNDKEFYKFLTNRFNSYRNAWPEMLMDLPDTVTEDWVSKQLKRLGMDEGTFYKSIGTVGGGNHFIEYDEVDSNVEHIRNDEADSNDKSYPQAMVTMHFGSRNFGVKVCNYWMTRAMNGLSRSQIREYTNEFKKNYTGDKRDLGVELQKYLETKKNSRMNGYLTGDDMKGYLMDMCLAQAYASWNHQTVQRIIKGILDIYNIKVVDTIKTTHNYVSLIDHTLRKSAIRAEAGNEVLVPFNMRDGIAICSGKGNKEWLESCAHGAGRKMSRSAAKKNISMEEFKNSMKDIYSTSVCEGTLDESPQAYKDTNEILELIQETVNIKCVLKPRINIKATNGN